MVIVKTGRDAGILQFRLKNLDNAIQNLNIAQVYSDVQELVDIFPFKPI